MVAFFWNLGFAEIAVVLIVSVLIFGKRLPQVAGEAFRQMSRLRRHLDTLRRESGIDREIFDVKRSFRDLGRDIEVEPTPSRTHPRTPAWRERRESAEAAPAPELKAAESAEPRAPEEPPPEEPPREEPMGPPEPERPSGAS